MPEPIDWKKSKYKHLWEEIRFVCSNYLLACDDLEVVLVDVKAARKRCIEVYAELQFELASAGEQGDKWEWERFIAYMNEVANIGKRLRRTDSAAAILSTLRLHGVAAAKKAALRKENRKEKKT